MKRQNVAIIVFTLFFLIVNIALVRAAPTLNVTGFDADGISMTGNLTDGYILDTYNVASTNHLIQFSAGTTSDETLNNSYFPLMLISSTVSASDLKAYYDARGVPEPFLTYLKNATDESSPFAYIKGDGTTNVQLVDAAMHDLAHTDVDMTIPDDYPLGTYTVQGTIINSSEDGNSTVTFILHIIDDMIPPVITPQPDIFLNATGPSGAIATFSVSAIDDIDGLVPVYCTPASGSLFGFGNTSVNCSSSDNHGNSANITFNINVQDMTPPSITPQSDLTFEATNSSGAIANFTISASDIVDGSTNVSCSPDTNTLFPFGSTLVTCTSSDSRNNTASLNFNVTVVDTISPVTTDDAPSGWNTTYFNITLSATDIASGVAWTNYCIEQTDNCTPNITGTNIEINSDGIYYLWFQSGDFAGNNEIPIRRQVLVDKTSPNTTDNAPSGWQNKTVNITLNPYDATSNISLTQYCIDQSNTCTPNITGTNIIINTDGTNYIRYNSTDVAGNVEQTRNKTILLDATAPTTIDNVPSGWLNHTINITLNATDLVTGVNWTKYCVDLTNNCTPNITVTNTTLINITTEGIKYIRYNSADNLNNIETIKSTQILIDLSPPNTTANITSGWKNYNVSIMLTSNDNLSGVNRTLYCTDQVNNCTPNIIITNISNIQFNYSIEGNYSIRYESIDNVGNNETIRSIVIGIDKNVPITTDNAPVGWQNSSFTIILTAGDTRSGVNWTKYCISSVAGCTPTTNGNSVLANLEGISYLSYNSSDKAGNQNVIQSKTIQIDRTAPSLNVSSPTIRTYNTTNISLNFTVSDPLSGVNSCWYTLDNNITNITGCNNITLINLSETPHSIIVYAKDNVGNINKSQVISIAVSLSLPAPLIVNSSNITVNNTNNTIIVVPYGLSMQNVNVTLDVPENYLTTLNMIILTNSTSMGRYINLTDNLTLSRNTTTRLYAVTIPAGTVISGPADWDGILDIPTIVSAAGISPTVDSGMLPSISNVVEFGNVESSLTFDHAARIIITGYASQIVGYSRAGTFTEIINTCAADNQSVGDALPADSECRINVGNDLVIWTKHFTSFVMYTQYPIPVKPASENGGGTVSMSCSDWGKCVDGKQYKECKFGITSYQTAQNCTSAEQPTNTANNDNTSMQPSAVQPNQAAESKNNSLNNGITGGVVTDIAPLSAKTWMAVLVMIETGILITVMILLVLNRKNKRIKEETSTTPPPYNTEKPQQFQL